MKVAQFNTFPYGGAATAAKRLHKTLRANRIDSQFYYHRNVKDPVTDPSFHHLTFGPTKHNPFTGFFKKRVAKRSQKETYRLYNEHIATRPKGLETFSMAQLPDATNLPWQTIDADVMHLHWISFFADYSSFFASIPDHVPIVWTLHDMNAFTGGCHYSNGCTRFQFGCGGCPQVTNSSPDDVSAVTFDLKRRTLSNKTIQVVTPSDWMRNLAMQSDIWPDSTEFKTIRLGFDLDVFSPVEKQSARASLGIDNNATLIAFGAEDINNKRKGMHHLISSLAKLETEKPIECLVFGSGEIQSDSNLPYVHHFGYVDSEEEQATIYNAADIVVVPSREDNQPQVGLEAMACGTPVVAFNAGGIPEYVRDDSTGLLASLGDEDHLAERLSWLVDNSFARQQMGRQARLMMESEFELGQQTQAYASLYSELCGINSQTTTRRAA